MTEDERTFTDVIMEHGGPAKFARKLRQRTGNKTAYTSLNARTWKSRNSIPAAYWIEIAQCFKGETVRGLKAIYDRNRGRANKPKRGTRPWQTPATPSTTSPSKTD